MHGVRSYLGIFRNQNRHWATDAIFHQYQFAPAFAERTVCYQADCTLSDDVTFAKRAYIKES